jgi:glycosyltransferase involved in cell wall biosynthesis
MEVIVVNDGSTDGTPEILASFTDPRVKIVNQDNRGLPAARNTGLRHATGEYVIGLDGDDIAVTPGWRVLMDALDRQPQAVLAYGAYRRFFGEGDRFDTTVPFFRRWKPSGDVRRRLTQGNFIPSGTAMVRRAFIERSGGYNENLTIGEDWEMWCRLACYGDFIFLPVMTLGYRQREGSMMAALSPDGFLEQGERTINEVFADARIRAVLGSDLERYKERAFAHGLFGASLLMGRKGGNMMQALSYLRRAVALDPAKSLFFGAVFALRTLADRFFTP